jgi:hypothetical protein
VRFSFYCISFHRAAKGRSHCQTTDLESNGLTMYPYFEDLQMRGPLIVQLSTHSLRDEVKSTNEHLARDYFKCCGLCQHIFSFLGGYFHLLLLYVLLPTRPVITPEAIKRLGAYYHSVRTVLGTINFFGPGKTTPKAPLSGDLYCTLSPLPKPSRITRSNTTYVDTCSKLVAYITGNGIWIKCKLIGFQL